MALHWVNVDLDKATARICQSWSDGQFLTTTKTGRERTVELSARLVDELAKAQPSTVGSDTPVFPNESGGLIDPHNFRSRVFRPITEHAFGPDRRFSPHGLRHTFASLHLAHGTNLKWIQAMGGWSSAKLLLDLYGHFLPTETTGYANALTKGGPGRPYTGPPTSQTRPPRRSNSKRRGNSRGLMAPRAGLEPATRCLEGSRSIQLSYRGTRRETALRRK